MKRDIFEGDKSNCAFCMKEIDTHYDYHLEDRCSCCHELVSCCLSCAKFIAKWYNIAKPIIEEEQEIDLDHVNQNSLFKG